MSIYVIVPVLETEFPDVPGTGDGVGSEGRTLKLVCVGLADKCEADGTNARAGIRRLARVAQCHTKTVRRALDHLVTLGAIHRETPARQGARGAYRIDLEWLAANVSPRADARSGTPRADARSGARADARSTARTDARTDVPTSIRPRLSPRLNGFGPDLSTSAVAAMFTPPTDPWDVGDVPAPYHDRIVRLSNGQTNGYTP